MHRHARASPCDCFEQDGHTRRRCEARLMVFSLRTNRRRVTANRHMAIAAGGLQECVRHMFGLPMRHRRTEFGM